MRLDPRIPRWIHPDDNLDDPLTRYRHGTAFAALAYREESVAQPLLEEAGYSDVVVVDAGHGAQFLAAWSARHRRLGIGLRGSEARSWREFWRDWIRADAGSLIPRTWKEIQSPAGRLWLPAGFVAQSQAFLAAYRSGRARSFVGAAEQIWMFGHSLGGACAHQVAMALDDPRVRVLAADPARPFGKRAAEIYYDRQGVRSESLMNTSGGRLSVVTGLPPWADHGGRIRVLAPRVIYSGDAAMPAWRAARKLFKRETPRWRLISRLFRRERDRVGAHLMRRILDNLESVEKITDA